MVIRDLPDYEKRIIVVSVPGEYPGFVQIDHRQIKGLNLKNPYVALCVPISVENPALAYDAVNDLFKVRIDQWNIASIIADVSDKWARQLGKVDLSRVLGADLAHNNPVISRLTNGAAFIDPRDRNWTLGASDVPDLMDRAMRLLGKVYGTLDVLQQQATTKELLVQIAHAGTPKDPTQIRALTSGDIITAVQATAANLKNEPTQTTRTNLKVMPEREDAINLGGSVSPNAAGVQILAPNGSKQIKVYDAGYHAGVSGTHYFYFGTATTATTRRFCTLNSTGLIHKTFVMPRVSNAADGLYLYASVNDPGIPYDLNYVQE